MSMSFKSVLRYAKNHHVALINGEPASVTVDDDVIIATLCSGIKYAISSQCECNVVSETTLHVYDSVIKHAHGSTVSSAPIALTFLRPVVLKTAL